MSIASEIERISANVQNTIDTIGATGVAVPSGANSDDLPALAQSLADTKQDKLTGVQGQVVGFDAKGNAVAQKAPSGLPEGGTPGQMLYQGKSRAEWGIPPYLGSMPQLDYSQMKSLHALGITDLNDVVEPGTYVGMSGFGGYPEIAHVPYFASGVHAFFLNVYKFVYPIDNNLTSIVQRCYPIVPAEDEAGGFLRYVALSSSSINPPDAWTVEWYKVQDANSIAFTPGTTGLSADNVQDALEELASRKGIFLVKAESQSGTLMADKTLSEIHQAIDDGLVPFLLYVSTSSFIPLYGTTDPTQSVMFVSNYGADTTVYTVMSDQTITVTQTDSTPKRVTITLTASGWSNNTQTVTVNGVLADETKQLIQPMPAVASQAAYMSAGIYCSGQAANSLTFTCSETPTEDIALYIVITEVGA